LDSSEGFPTVPQSDWAWTVIPAKMISQTFMYLRVTLRITNAASETIRQYVKKFVLPVSGQMANGKWQMANSKWQMANGKWQIANGK